MTIKFYGACREVTGSCILVESGKSKVLLDCGFFQGTKMAEERNFSPLPFDPKLIDSLVVCHAHLDHVGRIPFLYKMGFRGKIFSTAPTKELAYLVLDDAMKLMMEEAKREKRKVLYGKKDVEESIELFETIDYDEKLEITNNVFLTLKNAGHILGSAVARVEAEGKKLVYTSDLGNVPSTLLKPPETIGEADFVICESTYGGRVHEDISRRQEKLGQIIGQTISQNGILMIPTFAIERTQELLHDIEHFCKTGNCALPTFFLDSPLAQKVTDVFEKYPEYLNVDLVEAHRDGDLFGLKRLKITNTVSQSQGIKNSPNPKVVIAGSGMMNGGRILHHILDFIEDSNNALLIIGYQAAGTLGRRILDGETEIRVYSKTLKVNAKVMAIGSYSAHADGPQILNWLSKIANVKKIFLVHGEVEEQEALAASIAKKLNQIAEIPQLGQEFTI